MRKRNPIRALGALALCALLAACAATDTQRQEQTDPADSASPELRNPSVAVDGPAYEGDIIKGSPYVGRFESSYSAQFASDAQDVYVLITQNEAGEIETEPLELPVLECREDGTFSLTVATAVGGDYATLNGTFTVDGEHAEFTVAQGNYGDFLGADTEKFTCRLLNHDEIRYWGDQIGTVIGGDIFRRVA